jgi:hypothetical protein
MARAIAQRLLFLCADDLAVKRPTSNAGAVQVQRRSFLFALGLTPFLSFPLRAAPSLKVIYIGGWDCLPCSVWKKKYKQDWLASAEFKRVTWIEIEAPHLKEAYEDAFWPADLRPIRDQLPKKTGTPRFLIVADGKVMSNRFGKWNDTVADLKRLLAKSN